MKLLLDTHSFLWWLSDQPRLSREARVAIANPLNIVFVSAVSIIEIALKQSKGKLTATEAPELHLDACRFHELPIKIHHASALRELPPIHHDPFDRLLAAQAKTDALTLVTCDFELQQYDIPFIAA